MTRIVQLTIYPLKSPRHGGQLRCAAIRERYRSMNLEVETVAVVHGAHYRAADQERNDIVLPADHPLFDPAMPRFTDLQAGLVATADPTAWRRFAHTLDRLKPDIIQLEQPWLYPPVKRWLEERDRADAPTPSLIYSSQNIEWKLKRDEVSARASGATRADAIARVEALERDVVRASRLVIACTDEERAELRAMAGDDAPGRAYVTAHNAIAPFDADASRVAAIKQRIGLDRYALFVGSAHPPNVDGFWEMLAPSLAFLRPDEKIVVAGGVGHILRQHRVYADWPGINEPRLAVLGEMERDDLVALLGGATVVMLPITTGGGSNLKTAEAIYSGRPVLATPHALRGYGNAKRWPTIAIADTSAAFRHKLRTLLDDEPHLLRGDYARVRSEITWEHALQPLADAIAGVVVDRGGDISASFATPAPSPVTQPFRERFVEIQRVVATSGIDYEAMLERHYTKLIRPGDTVVDIGAHTGRHLAKFLTCVGTGGRLVAFEPLPYAHAILSKTFRAANVTLHKVALTDTVGNLEFVHAEGSPEESGLRQRIYNNPSLVKPRRIKVVADTLDRHEGALSGLSFIKIDVEGAEMNVLRGAGHVLQRYRPIVSVEYGRPAYGAYGNEPFTLFDFAEERGFAMYDIFANRLDREAWAIACDSIYWDFFMVPHEKEAFFVQCVPPVDPRSM